VRAIKSYRSAYQTAEDMMDRGIVIVGSPETVRQKLAAYQDLAGFNISLTKTQFGTMPHEMARENQIAVAEEILPYFRDRVPQELAQTA
jgi:alkanesulfonate monooxygenase SsuD/methylene tetrahydromethanopterin reductase-like flavin-dependent oxidoreductase (luciferase family)